MCQMFQCQMFQCQMFQCQLDISVLDISVLDISVSDISVSDISVLDISVFHCTSTHTPVVQQWYAVSMRCDWCVSDLGGHSVGPVLPDRRGQRADTDGDRVWRRPLPRPSPQSSGCQSAGQVPLSSLLHLCSRAVLWSGPLHRLVNFLVFLSRAYGCVVMYL